tara:strand:+ start:206 stop:340 length:135 start_codon:yes stop_codon:yes gene_type:complete
MLKKKELKEKAPKAPKNHRGKTLGQELETKLTNRVGGKKVYPIG